MPDLIKNFLKEHVLKESFSESIIIQHFNVSFFRYFPSVSAVFGLDIGSNGENGK